MDEENYIPASEIISTDDIPEFLGFVQESLSGILSKILISDLDSDISIYGDPTVYTFNLVFPERIAIGIMGANGLALVLNPAGNRTEIPMTVGYGIPILKHIDNFDLTKFDFSPSSFFDLILGIASISDEKKLDSVINLFNKWYPIDYEEDDRSPDEVFVDDFNEKFNPTTPLELLSGADQETLLKDLVNQLTSNGNEYDINEVIFSGYILDADAENMIYKIEDFFTPFLGNFTLENIKKLLVPQVFASLEDINLALEFPRTWLKPVDANNQPIEDENEKSKILFEVGSVRFSTENGLEFEGEHSFTFTKSEIGNTGMTLDFKNMKLDLSRTKNIPEATAAGYPDDFVGVFVESAKIGLPEQWFTSQAGATLGIFGENLLLGTGGISGTFGLRTIATGGLPSVGEELKFKLGGEDGLVIGFKQFDFTLNRGEFVSTNIKGSLTIPSFKKENSNDPVQIDISMSFGKDGSFYITAEEPDNIFIKIPAGSDSHEKTTTVIINGNQSQLKNRTRLNKNKL